MIKTRDESTLEVWGMDYINSPEKRLPEDQNKIVIQLEKGNGQRENYIVEVIEKREL